MRGLVALGTVAALLAAPVQAACWTRDEAAAAGVRQLQSMLMVSALRCEAGGMRVMGDYNAFVTANRTEIAAQNDRIRGHFIHALGLVAGERAYDAFTTSMANGYGAGEGAPSTCGDAADLMHEAGASANSRDALMMLVDQLGIAARLPDGRCEARPLTVASVTPLPPVVAAAAAVPEVIAAAPAPQPVSYTPASAGFPY